jgi:hypothetical protein
MVFTNTGLGVDAINDVLPLVVLVTIHCQDHVWCFTLEYISKQW